MRRINFLFYSENETILSGVMIYSWEKMILLSTLSPPPHISSEISQPYSSLFAGIKFLYPVSRDIRTYPRSLEYLKMLLRGLICYVRGCCHLRTGTRLCRCRWWAGSPRRRTRRRTLVCWRWERGWRWLWPESLNSAPRCSCHPGCSRANTHTQ